MWALAVWLVLLGGAGSADAEGSVPSGEVASRQAQEVARRADPVLLALSSAASLEGQSVRPAIGDGGEELVSTGALTSSTISKEVPGQFAVNTPDGELSLTPLATNSSSAASTPTVVNGAAALFADAWPAADAIVRPAALGATAIVLLRSAAAPTSFSWEVGLGPGQRLQQLENGSVVVVAAPLGSTLAVSLPGGLGAFGAAGEASQGAKTQYAAATTAMAAAAQQTADPLMVIGSSTATDASGESVSAYLSVVGDTITMTLAPGAAPAYPVVATLSVAAPSDRASAARTQTPTYGFSDQRLGIFDSAFDPRLLAAPLSVRVARLVIPYETGLESVEEQEGREKEANKLEYTWGEYLTKWLQGVQEVNAGGEHLRPYITLWSKGCLEGKVCAAPPIGSYRMAVEALIKRYMQAEVGLPAVAMWGAWNEPDGGKAPLPSAKAAELWQVAHSAMVSLHCDCTMVAGEFSEFEQWYISQYKEYMVEHHLEPRVWGLHDYHDLGDVGEPLASYANQSAMEFADITNTRLGKPRIWLSEQGVELNRTASATRLKGDLALQRAAAEDFLRLASVSSRTELVDYYMLRAPEPTSGHPRPETEEKAFFDSALLNEKGEPRPAYCVLAYVSRVCPSTVQAVVAGHGDRSRETRALRRESPFRPAPVPVVHARTRADDP